MSVDFRQASTFATSSALSWRSWALVLVTLLAVFFLAVPARGDPQLRGIIQGIGGRLADELFQMPQPPDSDNGSWLGQRIMMKQAGVKIRHSDDSGRQIESAELTDLVYTVLGEQNGWVNVRHRGVEDWVPKEEAVLLEDAVAYFTQKLRVNDRDAFALAHRGRAWQEEGDLRRALADSNDAIRLDPRTAAWFGNRGLVHQELHEYDLAIRDYDDALRLDPKDAFTYNNRGVAYKASKEYDQAIRDYSEAIRLDPTWTDALYNRANAYKARKDMDRAVGDYNEVIRLDPQWTDAYFNRGNAHKARKAYDQAVSDFRAVIRLDGEDADAYSSLAWLLATCPDVKVRDGRSAVEYATRACDLTSWKSSYSLAILSAAYAEMGNFDEALRWQKRALESRDYERDEGPEARRRLDLFVKHQPYREE